MQQRPLHIINKNTLNIEVGDMDAAQKINTLTRQMNQPMLNALEEALDACDTGENITIDKLHIDLSFLSPEDFSTNFISKLKQKLIQTIAQQQGYETSAALLSGGHRSQTPAGQSPEGDTALQAGIADNKNNPVPKKNITRNTIWDTFEYYLGNGIFPWWFAGNAIDFIENLQEAWPKESVAFSSNKVFRLLENPQLFQRFIQLIPPDKLQMWAGLIAGNGAKNLYQTVIKTTIALQKNNTLSLHHVYGWILYTAFIAKQKYTAPQPENIITSLKYWLQKMQGTVVLGNKILQTIEEYPRSLPTIVIKKGTPINNAISIFVQQVITTAMAKDETKEPGKGKTSKTKKKIAAEDITTNTTTKKDRTPDSENKPKPARKSEADGVMVANAGIVICWPFLSTAFKKLGWIEEGKFIDIHSQKKAVLFLHYIVYKAMPEDESPLYLNKLLCGMEAAEFISVREDIGPDWEEMREGMLKAILQSWEALKSASVEGLVETFLIRNGKVKPAPNGYHIQVERKGFDVLLDRLPWPISIIKLTWNKTLISVTW